MGSAPRAATGHILQVPAGYMEHGVDIQLPLAGPDGTKRDSLGMAEQPGGLVVQGGLALLERTDPQEDGERLAVASHGSAVWRWMLHGFGSGWAAGTPANATRGTPDL